MKLFAACVVLLFIAAGSVAAVKEAGFFNQNVRIALPPPTRLAQVSVKSGRQIPLGAWTGRHNVRFVASRRPNHPDFRLQVQLAKDGTVPTGNPTATQARAGRLPHVVIRRLADGTYRWWARFYNGSAASSWVPFTTGTAFGVDTLKPAAPVVSSSTDPVEGKVYRSGSVVFNWTAPPVRSGIASYGYDFIGPGNPTSTPVFTRTTATTLSFSGLATGAYKLFVRTRDRAGDIGTTAVFRVRLDSTAPTVADAGFSTFNFNPHYTSMTMNYLVTRPSWVHIGIYRASDNALVRFVVRKATTKSDLLHYTWHGRDNHGHIVSPGAYNFFVRTTDAFGNTSIKEYSGLYVLDQVIIVSLSQQRLWAYQDHRQYLTSLVTTGNPLLPTPRGTFTIMEKEHPFTFISPFPTTSWKWYAPSKVEYAMLFRVGGYYIHDAPWRSVFGPGSNAVAGKPGTNDTGTHGCVNVPGNIAAELFAWAPNGTPVKVIG